MKIEDNSILGILYYDKYNEFGKMIKEIVKLIYNNNRVKIIIIKG
jgi:hypothetical protein